MSKTYTKTIGDEVRVDDATVEKPLKEFCLVAHAHLQATDIDHALRLIAEHLIAAAVGDESDGPFIMGDFQLRLAAQAHEVFKNHSTEIH